VNIEQCHGISMSWVFTDLAVTAAAASVQFMKFVICECLLFEPKTSLKTVFGFRFSVKKQPR
jgi:hypothetical protein